MDGKMSFKRLMKSTKRILGELGAKRLEATSTKERAVAEEAADDVRADLLELAEDLEERAEHIQDYWGRDPMPWADHVARQEAIKQREELLALLDTTAAPAAPVQAAQRPVVRPIVDPRAEEIKRLEKQLEGGQRQAFEQQAIAKAQALVRAGRAFPAECKSIVAIYTAALLDDQRDPTGQRVAMYDEYYAARQPHSLLGELIATNAGGVLESNAAPKSVSEERRKSLLAMTPLGQAILGREREKMK